MKYLAGLAALILGATLLPAQTVPPSNPQAWKEQAFRLMDEGNMEGAVVPLGRHVEANPDDVAAAVTLATLFFELNRLQEAVVVLERLHEQHPRQEVAYFNLGVAYVAMKRFEDAEAVFEALTASANADMAASAAASLRQVRSETERAERLEAQEQVFALAGEGRHQEVLEEIRAIEERWGLVYSLELQRLYALYELQRFQEAAQKAQTLAAQQTGSVDLDFLRAELFMKLDRPEDARAVWRKIEEDHPGTLTALEAQRRSRATLQPEPATPSDEDRFFALARDEKHEEVVEGIDGLEENTGSLSWMMELQRLYSLQALGRNDRAWRLSEKLLQNRPESPDLSFVRAEILMRQGRRDEAVALWQQIAKDHPDTPVAVEARRRITVTVPPPPPELELELEPNEEDPIYELARQGRHAEAVAAIDALEAGNGDVSWMLQMQRLYGLQNMGDGSRALALADSMGETRPDDPVLGLVRADLLIQKGRVREASVLLREQSRQTGDGEAAEQARRRLSGLPPIFNLDKSYWGEAFFSGDYQGRFGTVVGYGLVRHGYFVPKARWLQPYAEFRFSVDTDSGSGGNQTLFFDNYTGFYGGVRAQVVPTEYLFIYAQGGVNQDLLDNRDDGDWAYDYQAGLYGFKAWGSGADFASSPIRARRLSLFQRRDGPAPGLEGVRTNGFFWRPDWFLDAGADFSYYHRYASWIGYAQTHQGVRLFQWGPRLAFDTYLLEKFSWDVKGNFFDNFVAVGPGMRAIWFPCQNAQVVLRADYLFGFYTGRDGEDNRNGASGQFNGVEVGLSVGLRW